MPKYQPGEKFSPGKDSVPRSEICRALCGFFSEIMDITLAIFDPSGKQKTPTFGSNSFCKIIAESEFVQGGRQACRNFHRRIFKLALLQNDLVTEECPWGLLCFSLAIPVQGQVVGVICGGHIKLFNPDTSINKERLTSADARVMEAFHALPGVSRELFIKRLNWFAMFVRVLGQECYEKDLAKKRLHKLAFASEISRLVKPDLQLRDLLHSITREIAKIIEVDRCSIALLESGRNILLEAASNLPYQDPIPESMLNIREGTMGLAPSSDKTLVIDDVHKVSRTLNILPRDSAEKSAMFVPLKLGQQSIGVMHLATIRNRHKFTPEEIEMAEALASEVALAIESTRLYEESRKKAIELERSKEEIQSYFIQVGNALSSALNLNQLLRLIVELCIRLTKADAGSLYLIDDRKLSTRVALGLQGERSAPVRIRLRESLIGWPQQGLNPDSSSMHTATELLYQEVSPKEKIRSYLGIPVCIKDEIKGLLNIYAKERREFQPEEVGLLVTFASQAALAIENAQNYELEQRRAKEATMLYRGVRTIGQCLDLQEVLALGVQQLAKIAEVDRCIIFLLDEKRPELYMAAEIGLSEDQKEFFTYFRLPTSQFKENIWENLKVGRAYVFTSTPPECPALEKLFSLMPTNSCLIVPLLTREYLLGMIYLDDSQMAHHFTDHQIRLVMTLGVHIGTAIQRAKLIMRLEENYGQMRALLQVSAGVSGTLSLPKVFNLVVDKAAQLMQKPCCALLVWDEIRKEFILRASRGLGAALADQTLQNRLVEFANIKKRPACIYISSDAREGGLEKTLWEAGVRSALSIPLMAKKRLIGILNCFGEEGYLFGTGEIRLLRSFASHAAMAVENARLYGIIRDKVRELATLFEVGKAITSTLKLNRVLEEIAQNTMKVMHADACSIMLLDPESKELSIRTSLGLGRHHLEQKIKLGEGIAGVAAKTGRPMILMDTKGGSPHKFPQSVRRDGLKTILSVPMQARGNIIGLINIYSKQLYHYTSAETNLLTALSNQAAIAIENAKLYEEQYNIAQILQTLIMPQRELTFPGIQVGHKYISSEELSGDYYDLIPLADDRFSVIIADVSGKGPSAAIYTAKAKYILKSCAAAGYEPREVIRVVNQLILPETEEDKFISLFYAQVDLRNKKIIYASAGHEPAIFWKQEEKKAFLLECEGLLVGVSNEAKFGQREIDFCQDDLLILYTDGITDARTIGGESFGLERLIDIINKYSHLSPQMLAERIYASVQKFTRRNLTDDFSLLLIKYERGAI